jgi:hypothetical protein
MSISNVGSTTVQAYQANKGNKSNQVEQKAEQVQQPQKNSGLQEAKNNQNSAIVKAQLQVSMQSEDQSMSLLYKTVLAEINNELAPELGENSLQKAYDQNLDVSPEATAERIVSSATAYFAAYREQNSDLSDEDAMSGFIDVIGAGIDRGFDDARDILESLSVLKDQVASNIDLTYEYVQSGLTSFAEQFNQDKKDEQPALDKQ